MTSKAGSPSQRLLSAVAGLRDEGKFTDLTLSHESGHPKVHQIIVCPQSKVLYKACTGGFEESFTGVVDMVDISYLELTKMVEFFYNMSYDDDIAEETEQETVPCISPLQLHARMFALGDRYDIAGLREVTVKKYSSRCAAAWIPLEFLESLSDVYERTPASLRQMRDTACFVARKNLPKMVDDESIATVYEKVLADLPEFTRDLLGIYVKAPLYGNCGTCCSNQVMEALQVRCLRCGKGMPGSRLC